MPFKSEKHRKYMHAKHPEIAKKWENEYAYGGPVGGGESVAGTSSDGTDNRHVFKEGGVPISKEEREKLLRKEGVPYAKLRRFLDSAFDSEDDENEEEEPKKESKFDSIKRMFKKEK